MRYVFALKSPSTCMANPRPATHGVVERRERRSAYILFVVDMVSSSVTLRSLKLVIRRNRHSGQRAVKIISLKCSVGDLLLHREQADPSTFHEIQEPVRVLALLEVGVVEVVVQLLARSVDAGVVFFLQLFPSLVPVSVIPPPIVLLPERFTTIAAHSIVAGKDMG